MTARIHIDSFGASVWIRVGAIDAVSEIVDPKSLGKTTAILVGGKEIHTRATHAGIIAAIEKAERDELERKQELVTTKARQIRNALRDEDPAKK